MVVEPVNTKAHGAESLRS